MYTVYIPYIYILYTYDILYTYGIPYTYGILYLFRGWGMEATNNMGQYEGGRYVQILKSCPPIPGQGAEQEG
jgi:hypothetical protein